MSTGDEYDPEKARLKRLQDFKDSVHESVGVDVGKIRRFLRADQDPPGRPRRDRDAKLLTDFLLMQLADAAYRRAYESLELTLDRADEASRLAMQDIARKLADLARSRAQMLDQAYTLPDGRRVFMTRDGNAAYDEHGQRLTDDEFDNLPKDQMDGRSAWEDFADINRQDAALRVEEDAIRHHDEERQRLRARMETGEMTREELEEAERRLEESMPAHMRQRYDELGADDAAHERPQDPSFTLSADELGQLDRSGTSAAGQMPGKADFPTAPPVGTVFASATTPAEPRAPDQPAQRPAPAPPSGMTI